MEGASATKALDTTINLDPPPPVEF
jgi:hypothetical protein